MASQATLHNIQEKQVFEVDGQFFEIVYRTDIHFSISPAMEATMTVAAAEDNRKGNRSSLSDPIPFEIWGENEFLSW